MSLNRFYNVWDMGFIPDDVATFDGSFYYVYSGAPSWFNTELISAGRWFPSFSFTPPQGTSGVFTINVSEFHAATTIFNSSGTITINVQSFIQPVWVIDLCNVVNLAWMDISGGWESYMFAGRPQAFQDKGRSAMHINSDNERRFHRKDEIYQGVTVSTRNINSDHALFIGDLFKSIQAFLISDIGNTPILIDPRSFRKVRAGDPFAKYVFDFTHAVQDVIQTQ